MVNLTLSTSPEASFIFPVFVTGWAYGGRLDTAFNNSSSFISVSFTKRKKIAVARRPSAISPRPLTGPLSLSFLAPVTGNIFGSFKIALTGIVFFSPLTVTLIFCAISVTGSSILSGVISYIFLLTIAFKFCGLSFLRISFTAFKYFGILLGDDLPIGCASLKNHGVSKLSFFMNLFIRSLYNRSCESCDISPCSLRLYRSLTPVRKSG